jgi:DNA-binding transcriptional LysR family regulator
MKIEQLQQLIQVAESGSLNVAAKKLYISRSSLSSSMKQLEDELGESIFVRHSKGIRLTEYGTIVLKQARDICDRIDFLHGTSQEKAAQRLTVASMFCSVANDAFADLVAEHPDNNFRMSIEECPLFQVIQRVGTGICRIGILTEYSENSRTIHHMLEENDLEYHVLSERTLGAIVGKNNPLYLTGRSEIELEELLRHPVLENYATPTDHAWEYTRVSFNDANSRLYVSDLGLALRLVSDTDAVMIDTYDSSIYRNLYARTDYHFIPIRDYPKCKTGWLKLNDTKLTPLEIEFIKLLEQKMLLAETE